MSEIKPLNQEDNEGLWRGRGRDRERDEWVAQEGDIYRDEGGERNIKVEMNIERERKIETNR